MTADPLLSPYERARLDKIKRNQERLRTLGLVDAKRRVRTGAARGGAAPPASSRRTTRRARAIAPSPARSSRRLKREPAQCGPLTDEDTPPRVVRRKFGEVEKETKATKFKCHVPAHVFSSPLTEQQKALIETKIGGNFLSKFEDYLTDVDTISDPNRRNVLRQITKLAAGDGIRYESKAYGWPDGCYFLRGTEVGPADDILKLMEIGREREEEWGRDRGNGWLLSHPLKKLYMFQQYHLQD